MANKQCDICDECYNCYYYWENNDTENECNGSEAPCHEWIAKRDIEKNRRTKNELQKL